jgi:hypothetical protein
MSVVTAFLFQLLAKQVEDRSLVVWYDPDRVYEDAFRQFQQRTKDQGPRTIRYDGSFFRLRHDIESLLNDLQPPRLVVYVPMTRPGPIMP